MRRIIGLSVTGRRQVPNIRTVFAVWRRDVFPPADQSSECRPANAASAW